MADILIRGMKMPKEGYLPLNIYPDGRVSCNFDYDCARAVPLPEGHGRLIDADALLNNNGVGTQIAGWGKMVHETAIAYAPTIVPAEGGTDNGF